MTMAVPETRSPSRDRPDAPRLGRHGPHAVGVRTDCVTLLNQPPPDLRGPRGSRPLTIESWYPAAGMTTPARYDDVLVEGARIEAFSWEGRAHRDAVALEGPWPWVLVSHGNTGSRVLMTWLTEHLASHGFVVTAIDHDGSIHGQRGVFEGVLYHRASDLWGVVQEATVPGVARDSIAFVGYSMGGFGVLNAAGARLRTQVRRLLPFDALQDREQQPAPSIGLRAAVAIAPYGADTLLDGTSFEGFQVPTLFIAGDCDRISGYDRGVRTLARWCPSSAGLMTLHGAGHAIGANGPPPLAWETGVHWDHYADAVWSSRRRHDLLRAAITAFLGQHLRRDQPSELVEADGVSWSRP